MSLFGLELVQILNFCAMAALLCYYTVQGSLKVANTCSAAYFSPNVVFYQYNIHFSSIILSDKFRRIQEH